MTTRRNFLTGMAGILASASAPAIVTQPMKLWTPKREIWTPIGLDIGGEDFTIESWVKATATGFAMDEIRVTSGGRPIVVPVSKNEWQHVALISGAPFVDGVPVRRLNPYQKRAMQEVVDLMKSPGIAELSSLRPG